MQHSLLCCFFRSHFFRSLFYWMQGGDGRSRSVFEGRRVVGVLACLDCLCFVDRCLGVVDAGVGGFRGIMLAAANWMRLPGDKAVDKVCVRTRVSTLLAWSGRCRLILVAVVVDAQRNFLPRVLFKLGWPVDDVVAFSLLSSQVDCQVKLGQVSLSAGLKEFFALLDSASRLL